MKGKFFVLIMAVGLFLFASACCDCKKQGKTSRWLSSPNFVSYPTNSFVPDDRFVEDITSEARVKIGHVSGRFCEEFYDFGASSDHDMVRYSTVYGYGYYEAEDIIDEIGGEEAAEMSLEAVYALMELQPKGEEFSPNGSEGVLLVNGDYNIFFVKNKKEEMRIIEVKWILDCWYINSYSTLILINGGSRVFYPYEY